MRCPSPTSSMSCAKGSIDGKRSTCSLQGASDTPVLAQSTMTVMVIGVAPKTTPTPARSRSSWLLGGLPSVVAAAGAGLVVASPDRPAQPMAEVVGGTDEQRGEQVLDLVAGQTDQPCRCWLAGPFGQGCDDQEGVGEHGQGDPAVPGPPAANLMLVQADQALAGLEAFLDGPAAPGDPDQRGQRARAWHEAPVEGQLAGLAVAADHEPALA